MANAIMPTYGRQDIAFVKGEGTWLEDSKGKRYLDAIGGLAVVVLGHANPAVAKTIADQSKICCILPTSIGSQNKKSLLKN